LLDGAPKAGQGADMSKEREEGPQLALDFTKLESVAAGGYKVIPAVAQDAETGAVLMLGYVNELALAEARRLGKAVFWSTSRGELWIKGASSGDWLELVDIRVNCEQNSLLYRVRPQGSGVCHTRNADGTARSSCYYRKIEGDGLAYVDDC
jgi:phosphoribosyl-AMP cyclohydrolase